MRWWWLAVCGGWAAFAAGGCAGPYLGDDDASDDDDAADDDAAGDDDDASDDDDTADDDTADDDTAGDDDDTAGDWGYYMYAHTESDLYGVEPSAPFTFTHLGTFDAPYITDLAIDIDGRMFATTFDTIYEVDPQTLHCTAVASMGGESFFSLTALSDGRLLAGSDTEIYRVDPDTGAISWWGSMDPWEFAGDMVGLPDGLLYGLMYPTSGQAEHTSLVVYDPGNGAVTEIGSTGAGAMFGVGFAQWTMFGFNTDGEMLEIDMATGAATVVATPGYDFWGAATNPLRWD